MSKSSKSKRPFRDYIRIFFSGFIMGSADVVPGVSGGTMAFILGIYEELIESIKAFTSPEAFRMIFTLQWKKAFCTLPWPFLLSLATGILLAIALLASFINRMLTEQPVLIWAFFFGLVVASIFAVFPRVRKWTPFCVAALIAGGVAGWIVVGLPLLTHPPAGYWYLILCGAVAICAMILPGISGSFILVLMGRYQYVLNAVHELKERVNIGHNLLVMALFCVGILIGISSFVRLLSWMFKRWHDLTVAVLIGFMAGSLRKVWPWKASAATDAGNVLPPAYDQIFWYAVGLAVAGFLIVMILEAVAKRLERRSTPKATEA